MIYFTSGTGNSHYVALSLARELGEDVCDISQVDPASISPYSLSGLVMPVYAWGVPTLMADFIYNLPQSLAGSSIWAVFTCGDETALAPEILSKLLLTKGISLTGIWSVIMPNNYVLLPGFNIDPTAIEKQKLQEAPARIAHIAGQISHGIKEIDVTRGSMPALKTRLVYPLFKRWGIFPKKWHVSSDCIHCGKCIEVCPVSNVAFNANKIISWGSKCVSCLGCFHVCPRHAINYASATQKKGQYFFRNNNLS